MGLQVFNKSRDNAVGDVKSRKNIENLSMEKDAWVTLISHTGGEFPVEIVDEFTLEELKCMIKLFDSEIESENFFNDSDHSVVRDTREDLVDVLKETRGGNEDVNEQPEEAEEAS